MINPVTRLLGVIQAWRKRDRMYKLAIYETLRSMQCELSLSRRSDSVRFQMDRNMHSLWNLEHDLGLPKSSPGEFIRGGRW